MSRIRFGLVAAMIAATTLTAGTALASSAPWHQTPCGSSTANDYGHAEPVDYRVEDPLFAGTALVVTVATDAGYADLTISPNSQRVGADGGNSMVSGSADASPAIQRVCVSVGDQQIILP